MMRARFLFPCAFWLLVSPASADRGSTAAQLAKARVLLATEVSENARAVVDRAGLARIHRAMADVRRGVSAYLHGEVGAGADAEVLRRQVYLALNAESGLLLVVDDLLQFRPEIHRKVARLARSLGDLRAAVDHQLLAIAASVACEDDLVSLAACYRALGEVPAALETEAQLSALRLGQTSGAESPPQIQSPPRPPQQP